MGRKKKRQTSDGQVLKTEQPRGEFKHGRHSKFVKYIEERVGSVSMLSEVEKLELSSMAKDILARTIAVEVDSYRRSVLMEMIKDYDMSILDYEADLVTTQAKMAEQEKNIQFHKTVLASLKEKYMVERDEDKRRQLLLDIDEREAQIARFEKDLNVVLDLRNKIRKEIDKKQFNEKQIKLKEEELGKKTIKLSEIDTIDLDE